MYNHSRLNKHYPSKTFDVKKNRSHIPKRFRTHKRPHVKLDFQATNVDNIVFSFYVIVAHFVDDFVVQVL
jgi:hypothetical protein